MPIVWSIVAVVVALAALVVLVVGLLRSAGRTSAVLGAYRELLDDRVGLLRARVAALNLRVARRRAHRGATPPSVPSGTTVPLSEGALQ